MTHPFRLIPTFSEYPPPASGLDRCHFPAVLALAPLRPAPKLRSPPAQAASPTSYFLPTPAMQRLPVKASSSEQVRPLPKTAKSQPDMIRPSALFGSPCPQTQG